MSAPRDTDPGAPAWRIAYAGVLTGILALIAVTLLFSKAYFGWYARPPFFGFFRLLDFVQLGLFVTTFLAVMAHWSRRLGPVPRTALVLPGVFAAWWLAVWAVVHAGFGMRLSVPQVWQLLSEPRSLQLVGLVPRQLAGTVAVLLLSAALVAVVLQTAAVRSGARFTRRVALVLLGGFAVSHLAVRGYFGYHVAHQQRAVLMLDEGTPLALRSENLIPGVARRRIQVPSLEDRARTAAYLTWVSALPVIRIPRKFDLLWVSVESLRFDALDEHTMPYLYAHRDEFQLRLGGDHWSGGNATKSGTFSMLTGLAAYHLQDLRRAAIPFPFLTLLAGNDYRLRIAKGLSFYYGDLRAFLPPQAVVAEVSAPSMPAGDRAMVDALLRDLEQRDPNRPAFDLLTFDATHWPYDDPEAYRAKGPSRPPQRIYNALRSPETVRLSRVRYATSLRFVDAELARVLERLRASGRLDRTIVVVTGDHGEEFLERGQLGHSSGMNDFQARVPLWLRLPGASPVQPPAGLTTNLDLIPTLLDHLGFEYDVLRTQGRSLLRSHPPRPLLMLAEQGWSEPAYHAMISPAYVSRWRLDRGRFLFSSVERRDGAPVTGLEWWQEVQRDRAGAALGYDVLPDVGAAAVPFSPRSHPERP